MSENFSQQLRAAKTANEFKPSAYQKAIFEWVEENVNGATGKSLVVQARAGTGKTTTGVQMQRRIDKKFKTLFLAFNKHIADEMRVKLPEHVDVKTYHALGKAAIWKAYGRHEVDTSKFYNVVVNLINWQTEKKLYRPITELTSLVKATLSGTSNEDLNAITDYYGIDVGADQDRIYDVVRGVVSETGKVTEVIDFDDMCWIPTLHNLEMEKYDIVFIDEAQDTNKAQLALAMSSVARDGIIIAVGDEYQSLYGFRGADANAIPSLITNLDAETLPLSITYRNPASVVRLVNRLFPEIPFEQWENAKDGEVRDMGYGVMLDSLQHGDMVLCRTNAPLVRPAFELIRRGVKAVIRGRDIGKNLLSLIDQIVDETGASTMTPFIAALSDYQSREVYRLMTKRKFNQAQLVEDKCETIAVMSTFVESINALKSKISAVFSDDVKGIVFSTIHRSKGLEADNIFVIEPDLIPHPMALKSGKEWELVQERNIEYVAYTRAMETLTIVR